MAASCPICYQPATGATYQCPGCQAVYHASCWPQTGCVVPNCQRPTPAKMPPASGPQASALWNVTKGAAIAMFVLLMLTLFLASSQPRGADGMIGFLVLAVIVTAGSAALASVADLATGAAGGRWLGTAATAVATWSLPVLYLAISSSSRMLRDAWEKLVWCAVLLAVVGVLADRRKDVSVANIIVLILLAIAVPNFHAARVRDGPRSCYANQKTIVGAVEMYNLDKNTKRTDLGGAFYMALKSGGYLQSIPQDPGEGAGTSGNYQLTSNGNGITCVKHGPIQIEEPR